MGKLNEETETRIRNNIPANPVVGSQDHDMLLLTEEIDMLRKELLTIYAWMDMLKSFLLSVNAQINKPERTH